MSPETLPRTVAEAFVRTVAGRAGDVAIRWQGSDEAAAWTWQDYADRVSRLSAELRRLGMQRGDRAVLLMRNQPSFHVCDFATVFAGGIPISIYTSSSPEQIAWQTAHCRARMCFVERSLADRVLQVRDRLPELRTIVVVDDAASPGLLALPDLLSGEPLDLEAAAAAIRPDDLVTVIYTSGTTGTPKGVMLTHDNVRAEFEALAAQIGWDGRGERVVSYLPMAHIAERVVSHYLPVFWGSEVTTCPDMNQLGGYLTKVRPTFFFGPPRVFEKMYAGITAFVAEAEPERRDSFHQALAVGHRVAELRASEQPLPADLAEQWAAVDSAVFAGIRQLLGIDQMRIMVSGAAPIPVEVLVFLRDIGAPMSELFGMSENTGAMIWDAVRVRPGSVGRALPGAELALASDGELLCRGPIVFTGYLEDPDRTLETLDADGWLHTGDVATMDADGYVRIVDRKKELIVTAGGKNVSPANLEAELKTIPLVGQAMVVGDGKPYLAALLVLDPEVAPAWAAASGLPSTSLADLTAVPAVVDAVTAGVVELNDRVSSPEQIRRFAILGEEWVADSEELTPTLKLKRRGVLSRHGPLVESLYAGGGISVGPAPVIDLDARQHVTPRA